MPLTMGHAWWARLLISNDETIKTPRSMEIERQDYYSQCFHYRIEN